MRVSLAFFLGVVISLVALGTAAALLGRLLARWSAVFAIAAAIFSLIAGLAALFGQIESPGLKRGAVESPGLFGNMENPGVVGEIPMPGLQCGDIPIGG